MTIAPGRRAHSSGRLLVLVLYGGLLAQIGEFAAYSAAHLPRAVNWAQFAFIGIQLAAWAGLWRLTRDLTGHCGRQLDEREVAIRDRAAWHTLRVGGLALTVLAGGYLLLHVGAGWLRAPSPQWLGLIAFAVAMATATLPSAVLAWTQPAPVSEEE